MILSKVIGSPILQCASPDIYPWGCECLHSSNLQSCCLQEYQCHGSRWLWQSPCWRMWTCITATQPTSLPSKQLLSQSQFAQTAAARRRSGRKLAAAGTVLSHSGFIAFTAAASMTSIRWQRPASRAAAAHLRRGCAQQAACQAATRKQLSAVQERRRLGSSGQAVLRSSRSRRCCCSSSAASCCCLAASTGMSTKHR